MSVTEVATLRVARFAERERMLRRTKRVLVALSGGPDSVACLLLLRNLRERFQFDIVACHFDHQLRERSASDMQRVREICAELGIECVTGEGDVRAMARDTRQSIELAARTMRYQFLAFAAGKELADAIATGHTADDQAETVLMRIVRGSGVRGVRGMLPVSGVPGSEAQRLVRPLLELTRADTAAICVEAGIVPITDESNADMAFTRNRVRLETFGALRALNPSVSQSLLGLAASARELFLGVERQVMSLVPRQRGPIGAVFPLAAVRPLPNEGLTLLVEREASFYKLAPDVNRTRVNNLRTVLEKGSGRVRFGPAEVEVSCGVVRIGPALGVLEAFEAVVLNIPGRTRAGPWRVDVSTSPLPELADAMALAIDPSAQHGALRARLLAPGDRISYHGMRRKVADVLANAKVPAWERTGMVAIADSATVLGLFGATVSIAADPVGEDLLYVRLSQLPPA